MSDFTDDVERLVPPPDNRALLIGLLIGALIGAAAVALNSPRSGVATRELLRERGLELKDRADNYLRTRRSPL